MNYAIFADQSFNPLDDEVMPNRWMGRGSTSMPRPPRSPDLTPCYFFLWGDIKSKAYGKNYDNIQDLKKTVK